MTVYVESDFVLTLALEQDDNRAAERLLGLARQRRIALKIPTFSLSEPFATVQNRANSRHRLIEELRKEIRELGRTQPHVSMAAELGRHTILMAQVLKTQLEAMEAVVLELSRNCELLQLNATVLARGASYRAAFNLGLQDAIVLASVILDLERERASNEALFISRGLKDFENTLIQDELRRVRCKYLADFTNAVRFIERPAGQAESS